MFKFGFLLILAAGVALADDYPHITISNGLVDAVIQLPDVQRGSYQGTRFDWSGIVYSLEWNGHQFVSQWYPHHDPKIHDAITGPVEEFLTNDAGLGYDAAPGGGTFIRIGVGTVRKPEGEKEYRRFATYEIVNPGKRSVRPHEDSVEFEQELHGEDGYAYDYRKTLKLTNGKPQLVLEHTLKNTGKKTIETSVYDHNFWVIDHEVVGPAVVVRFGFAPKALADFKGLAEFRGNDLVYKRDLETGESVFSELTGFAATAKDYNFAVENHEKSGVVGVKISGDRPLEKVVFWSIRTVACPEPYIHMKVAPGKEFKWRIVYDFYAQPE